MLRRLLAGSLLLALFLLASCQARRGGVVSDSYTVSAIPGVDESAPEFSSGSEAESGKPEDSSVPPVSSQPISSASSESASFVATEWWQKELLGSALEKPENYLLSCIIFRNSDMISVYSPDLFLSSKGQFADFSLVLTSAKETNDLGDRLTDVSFFEVLLSDYTKYTGTFYEKGIALTRSFSSEDACEPVLLAIDEKDYQTILDAARRSFAEEPLICYPSWLSHMKRTKCESITFTAGDGASAAYSDGEEEYAPAFDYLQNVRILPDTGRYVDKSTEIADAYKIHVTFLNGIIYDIQCSKTSLLIASSDMEQAVQYSMDPETAEELTQLFDDMAQGNVIVGAAKPVIYLYPEAEIDVSAKVNFKGVFTCTYPPYKDGWEVTAYPDGRLINHADGTEHYYLFWEGNYSRNWSFDEGFVVKGEDTGEFLQKTLGTLGLTPKEYNDFIVYWLPEMQQNPYNLITFATDEYEEIAPLEISPKPDSILRVHMVYKALTEPVEIPEQTLLPFTRRGFTVVEWGGTRAK